MLLVVLLLLSFNHKIKFTTVSKNIEAICGGQAGMIFVLMAKSCMVYLLKD